jgi:hypothetical protein
VRNYLHLGSEVTITGGEIIAILASPGRNALFLEKAAAEHRLRNEGAVNRSFVVAGKGPMTKAYFSKITSKNLIKRCISTKEE